MSLIDKLLLYKRAIIESMNEPLKNSSPIEHSKRPSVNHFTVNLLAGLALYSTTSKTIRLIYAPIYRVIHKINLQLALNRDYTYKQTSHGSVSMKTKLQKTLDSVEKNVGTFSAYTYSFATGNQHGQNIERKQKPAMQMLEQFGATPLDEKNSKNIQFNTKSGNVTFDKKKSITISNYDPEGLDTTLTIPQKRLRDQYENVRVYINTDIISPEEVHKIHNGEVAQEYNKSVGICIAQKVDLLVSHATSQEDKAITTPKEGEIGEEDNAILLLSSPALQKIYTQNLSPKERKDYIKGMYRNLFHTSLSENYEYIAMPAAGLGVYGGTPEEYFESLKEVAKEFPKLNIIYHPGNPNNFAIFQKIFAQDAPKNVVMTDKDVVFIADELTRNNRPCALHNPSDPDVVYGKGGPGQYWLNGKGANYVGEEDIGAKTTAALAGLHLQQGYYKNIRAYSPTAIKSYTEFQQICRDYYEELKTKQKKDSSNSTLITQYNIMQELVPLLSETPTEQSMKKVVNFLNQKTDSISKIEVLKKDTSPLLEKMQRMFINLINLLTPAIWKTTTAPLQPRGKQIGAKIQQFQAIKKQLSATKERKTPTLEAKSKETPKL